MQREVGEQHDVARLESGQLAGICGRTFGQSPTRGDRQEATVAPMSQEAQTVRARAEFDATIRGVDMDEWRPCREQPLGAG